jgi:hypothetical protein
VTLNQEEKDVQEALEVILVAEATEVIEAKEVIVEVTESLKLVQNDQVTHLLQIEAIDDQTQILNQQKLVFLDLDDLEENNLCC